GLAAKLNDDTANANNTVSPNMYNTKPLPRNLLIRPPPFFRCQHNVTQRSAMFHLAQKFSGTQPGRKAAMVPAVVHERVIIGGDLRESKYRNHFESRVLRSRAHSFTESTSSSRTVVWPTGICRQRGRKVPPLQKPRDRDAAALASWPLML